MYTDQASSLRREVLRTEQTIIALAKDVIIEDTLLGSLSVIGKKTGVHPTRVLRVIHEEVQKEYGIN